MDELMETLQGGRAAELANQVATRVSYQARPLGEPSDWTPPLLPELKLYQPSHGHFNLIAASLVCQMPGLPDRAIDPGQDEKAGFVLRRLSATGQELAWVNGPAKGWQPVAVARTVAENEELAPLVPVAFCRPGGRSPPPAAGWADPDLCTGNLPGRPSTCLGCARPDPQCAGRRSLLRESFRRSSS